MFEVSKNSTIQAIKAAKERLGEKLVILSHHYQNEEIVRLGDFVGDSLDLSRRASESEKTHYIIFCGVHFMAESAAILARPHQVVQIPEIEAGCWMADMVDTYRVEGVWRELENILEMDLIVPITYINSDATLKAFCGKMGGSVCTSSNAPVAFSWALNAGKKVFFFPDEHLGRNTANTLGIPREKVIVWNQNKPLGGNTPEDLAKAKVILWDGFCLVHTRFGPGHIYKMREAEPGARIIVHPECTEDVVALADAVGSTSSIVKYVQNSPSGSTIAIATEANLIHRLANEYPDKNIIELHRSLCPNMAKITLENLLWTLDNLGGVNVVKVEEEVKTYAKKALERMLSFL